MVQGFLACARTSFPRKPGRLHGAEERPLTAHSEQMGLCWPDRSPPGTVEHPRLNLGEGACSPKARRSEGTEDG